MTILNCDYVQELTLVVTAISALMMAISAIAAFVANHQNKKQYEESVQPQLSMSLIEFNGFLCLCVKNTGKLAARNIEIRVNEIKNNGVSNELSLDDLFNREFDLYPEEIVQGEIAIYGGSLDVYAFPQVKISVSYRVAGSKNKIAYDRTVTYLSAYTRKGL